MLETFVPYKTVQISESADGNCHNKLVTDCQIFKNNIHDTVDNPELKKLIGEPVQSEENILQKMKYECNRLYSFKNKWPLSQISPESLASAGFFYLQHEDRVQCPFCCIIIYNWTSVDKPLREHMKKSPKCPFLMGNDVGNIPLISQYQQQSLIKPMLEIQQSSTTSVNYKPKQPRMADVKRRLLTYSGWPLTSPSPSQLAECGLYYVGVADVVMCFFCGGSLGNWEPHDDPWAEHLKYFPDCAFLSLHKSKSIVSKKCVGCHPAELMKQKSNSEYQFPSNDVTSEVIKEALNIFPRPLVLNAVERKNGDVFTLQEICDDILLLNQKKKTETEFNASSISNRLPSEKIENDMQHKLSCIRRKEESTIKSHMKDVSTNPDALLCKICMDRERGVVFQPCGHLVSCWKCSQMISDCPVCRRPIINAIRTYFS